MKGTMLMKTILTALLALALFSSVLHAEIPDIDSFRVVPQFPQPADGSFTVVGTATPNGRFILWDGDAVFLQAAPRSHDLQEIATGFTGDPAFLALAPDGRTLAMGGGFNGRLYFIDIVTPTDFDEAGGFDVPTHFSGAYLNNTLLLVDRSTDDFSATELVIIDTEALSVATDQSSRSSASRAVLTLPEYDANTRETVIEKPLGSFSSTVFVNADRTQLFAMDSNTRELRVFDVSAIIEAFESATTLDWTTDGTPIGAPGDYFGGGVSGITPDNELIIGGSEGVGQPGGVMYIDPDEPAVILATLDPAGTQPFYQVIYNRPVDELIAIDGTGLPLMAYASTTAIAPIPPVSPCPVFGDILTQWTELTTEFELPQFGVDLDEDGLPEYASLRMVRDIGCRASQSLNEATRVAFDLNLDAFDEEADADALSDYREIIAALMLVSADTQAAYTALLAENGFLLTSDYITVTCAAGTGCQPEFEEKPAVFDLLTTRDVDEPYSGTGDIDGDGFLNVTEYNNVLSIGGNIDDFIIAAGSRELNGDDAIQAHADESGGCFVATAVYGTPLADEVNALRTVRDEMLLNNAFGTGFVDTYYRVSPALADYIAQSPALRVLARAVLTPFILLAKLFSSSPIAGLLLLILISTGLQTAHRFVRNSL